MLELRTYSSKELTAILGSSDNQAIKRKLNNYGIKYSLKGRGPKAEYTIVEIEDYFKVFSVFELGMAPQTDFNKFKLFVYLVLCDEEFAWRPSEMKEEYLRGMDLNLSRQVIAKYMRKLADYGLISQNSADFIYYRVYKIQGIQTHDIVSREEYSAAWKVYWDCKAKGYDTKAAFKCMYNAFGGTPRKANKIEYNGIYNELVKNIVEWLTEKVGDSE